MAGMRTSVRLLAAFSLITAGPALAWPGYSWDRWHAVSPTTRPAVTSPQAGETRLVELLRTAGPDSPRITSIDQWRVKQAHIRAVLTAFLGHPTNLTRPAPEAVVLDETPLADHVRRHIRIRCEPDDWITAYLLVPKPAPTGPAPVIICLHQTVSQGKDEAAGIKGDPSMFIARELVARGYLCLVPDVIGFGERLPEGATRRMAPGGAAGNSPGRAVASNPSNGPRTGEPPAATQPASLAPYDGIMEFFERHPRWSVMGKMNWDVSRCVDYLETLPQVDRRRIGCIGHSHGAYGAIFAAAFEPRIACVVASCGFTTLRTDPSPHRWSHLTPLLPAVGFYVSDGTRSASERPPHRTPSASERVQSRKRPTERRAPASGPSRAGGHPNAEDQRAGPDRDASERQPTVSDVPFDWHEICSLIAPRPYLNWATLNDSIFPKTDNLAWVFGQLGEVYALYGVPDRLAWKTAPGEHRFPKEAREWAYKWLDEQLRR